MGFISQREIEEFGSHRFINRELSWIDFAFRIADLAGDDSIPLLERAKFLAIISSGIDEFFQVRVAGLKDQLAAGVRSLTPDGLSSRDQLKAIRAKMSMLIERIDEIYNKGIVPGLSQSGIHILEYNDLDKDELEFVHQLFLRTIFPVLTPLSVDPTHPFPYISNLSLNLLVRVIDPLSEISRFARIKVPATLPRFIKLPGGSRFILLEQVISAHLSQLFPEMEIGDIYVFRVSRNADLTLEEEEADDLLAFVEMELRRRRFGRAVKLDFYGVPDPDVANLLLKELRLHPDDIYCCDHPLDLSGFWGIYALERPGLHDPDWIPVTPQVFADADAEPGEFFAMLRGGDILVHHPYESFSATVERFIEHAAADPDVLAIKQTLYRTSGDSRIVASLIKAAESGKQVAVLVEVKARFDEKANIAWARALEEAGVHVVYGLAGLKTHLKAVLVVRLEPDGSTLRYCHLGTGNYNSGTARSYEDIGLFTTNEEVGSDLSEVFNLLTGFSKRIDYRKLVLAPGRLRGKILSLIEEQASLGEGGYIALKVNGLVDPEIIDALYDASIRGAKVDLIVRSICSLRPGVAGLSENISVKSIVSKFLEHSRIFVFGNDESSPVKVFVGSADLMQRNLDRRIEAIFPIEDHELRERVLEVVRLDLADDCSSWELDSDGDWQKIATTKKIDAQNQLQRLADQSAIPLRRPSRRSRFFSTFSIRSGIEK